MPRVHAFGDDALGEDDMVGLLKRLSRREVSAAELADAAVARTELVDPRLSGLAHAAFEEARARADAEGPPSHQRPLAGVPTFVKDNADVAGMPTQQGSRAWTAEPALADGEVATLVHGLGLVTLGKTRLSEFGFNPSAEPPGGPPVRNPWDPTRTSGASSAGSAAFVAAGVVPLAHANDGGGSIRIPAACCGLVGLKPTRGRTPTEAMSREMPVKLVSDGVLTRSVRDTALFLREAEKRHRDLRLPPVGDIRRPGHKRLRIGLVTESIGARRTHPDCVRATNDLAHLLEGAGHRVEPVDPPVPSSFEDDFLTYWSLLGTWLHDTGPRTVARDLDRARLDPLTRGLARMGHRRLHRIPRAIARLRRSHRMSTTFYAQGYDVMLSPVLGYPAPELGVLEPPDDLADYLPRLTDFVSFTPLANATGDPALSLPTGATSDGLPLGVMVSGPHGSESTLLEVGFEVEALQPFRRIQDPVVGG